MSDLTFLPVLAWIEAMLIVGLVGALVIHRVYTVYRHRSTEQERKRIMEALGGWLLGTNTDAQLSTAIHAQRQSGTIRQLILAVASHVPESQREELATILRQERWQKILRRNATSIFWWRRLRAAQMLSLTATEGDAGLLAKLIGDWHPTVQSVAVRALLRVPKPELIAKVLDRLPSQPPLIRAAQGETLHRLWPTTLPLLVDRLTRRDASAESLEAWINFADMISAPNTFDALVALHTHPAANVRVAVARALRHCYQPAAESALMTLLRDPDWRIRGQAARGLGALSVQRAIPQLRDALSDPSWWVRFRAGLALAQMREPGRQALREARALPDRFASEMAIMISGLSDGSITELTEA